MPPQNSNKVLEFTGNAGGFFVMYLVSMLLYLIPLVGFAMSFNYSVKWMAENTKVNGRGLGYKATLGETWVMLFVGILLTVITFGIYIFWFGPKMYRFVYDHVNYADEMGMASTMPAAPAPMPATDVTPPSAPTPPTATLVQ